MMMHLLKSLLYVIAIYLWLNFLASELCHMFYLPRATELSKSQLQRKLFSLSDNRMPQNSWDSLARMIENKKSEVEHLIKEHSQPEDQLQARMSYMQHTMNSKLSESLRLDPDTASISFIADMKRKSPTNRDPRFRKILDYRSAEVVAENMFQAGFDIIMVNTDRQNWDGDIDDLLKVTTHMRKFPRTERPAVIMKDLIIHPIQIALAIENKADGIILNSMIVGSDLESLLASCMVMGTEAIVEVHTFKEAEYALNIGATIIMINQWDRIEGRLKPHQALDIKKILPPETITIATGGIKTYEQIQELTSAGFDGVCLGRKLRDDDLFDVIKKVKLKPINNKAFIEYNESGGSWNNDLARQLKVKGNELNSLSNISNQLYDLNTNNSQNTRHSIEHNSSFTPRENENKNILNKLNDTNFLESAFQQLLKEVDELSSDEGIGIKDKNFDIDKAIESLLDQEISEQ